MISEPELHNLHDASSIIGIGSDHGGVEMKEMIKEFLQKKGLEVKDFGTNTTDSVDYPDYGQAVAEAIVSGKCSKGIIICGTGLGISMAANKVSGIRAAVCTDTYMAKMSRQHNDANILSLGARVIGPGVALEIVEAWLNTDFEGGGRHQKRVDKIMAVEKKYSK